MFDATGIDQYLRQRLPTDTPHTIKTRNVETEAGEKCCYDTRNQAMEFFRYIAVRVRRILAVHVRNKCDMQPKNTPENMARHTKGKVSILSGSSVLPIPTTLGSSFTLALRPSYPV